MFLTDRDHCKNIFEYSFVSEHSKHFYFEQMGGFTPPPPPPPPRPGKRYFFFWEMGGFPPPPPPSVRVR